MPANLTPQYLKAEQQYRRAQSPEERVACLEEMLRLVPKHKGTDHLQADLKTRLKQARTDSASEKTATKKEGRGLRIPRQGAATVPLLGGPNAGKSRVLAELTNAKPEIAPYPFTTREPAPGMMPWQDVKVQLIDTPPITADFFEASVLGMTRTADAALLCLDGGSDDGPDQAGEVLDQLRQRKTVLDVTSGFGVDDYSIIRVKTLLVMTRGDDPGALDRLEYFRELAPTPFVTRTVELERPDSIEALRDEVYRFLDLIRIYTKAPGKPASKTAPFTLHSGGTVEDLAPKVHRDLVGKVKYAKVWGASAHDGQSVGLEHPLADGDLVELHT